MSTPETGETAGPLPPDGSQNDKQPHPEAPCHQQGSAAPAGQAPRESGRPAETADVWFPPTEDYVLAHRCPTCGAEPWVHCDAPRKRARHDRIAEMRREVGLDTPAPPITHLQHQTRQSVGIRHYYRDVGRAPWPEDRVPGMSYGTVIYPGAAR